MDTRSAPARTSGPPAGCSPTALITGASRGLGLALAQRLATDGWTLIVDARDGQALDAAADGLRTLAAAPDRIVAIAGDVTDAAHRADLARVARALGGLDAVVHNAGTLGVSPLPHVLDYPIDALAEVYSANVLAPLALTQAVRADLRPGAAIVAVTSDASVTPYEGWGGYGSSKAALDHLAAVLAVENPDLRVYAVDPGDMRTRMHQDAFPGEDISDRPLPEESVPGLLVLLRADGAPPSGRYSTRDLTAPTVTTVEGR